MRGLRLCFLSFAAIAAGIAVPAAGQTPPGIAALCGDRKPCSLVSTKPAGKDSEGRALSVVELNLGVKSADNDGGKCRPYLREFWVRVAGVVQAYKVLELCNDGYGAAGVGEDSVSIGPNRLDHTQMGGSAWRWDQARTIQLSPLKVLTETSCSYHNGATGFTTTRWDWQRLAGEKAWRPQRCDGKVDDNAEIGCDTPRATRRHMLVPMLTGVAELAKTGAVHLGSCAAIVDESGKRGHLVFGTARSNGAEMRVLLLSPRDLLVTVRDDKFSGGAASWLNDDHLELWLGNDLTTLACGDNDGGAMRQWGIGIADGKINAGHGNPKDAPSIARRTARTVDGRVEVTFHLVLPVKADTEMAPGLTVVYSKSANGKQVRLSATSPVRRGDASTLGSAFRIDAKAATCSVRDGRLDLTQSGNPALLGAQ